MEDASDGTPGMIQKDYILDLMKNPKLRQLKERINYDYVEIEKEMAEGGVEVREHQCGKEGGDQLIFVDAVRGAPSELASTGKPEYDWSEASRE